jgi:transitional endoplasmic reticulum ATPase
MSPHKALLEQRVVLPIRQRTERPDHRAPGAILFFGLPGVGKTALARATAGRLGWAFVHVDLAPVVLDAARLGQLFDRLLDLDQAVIFLDEFEHLGLKLEGQPSAIAMITAEFFRRLSALHASRQVLLVCATSYVRLLDPRLLRSGHFDLVLPIGLPDSTQRAALLQRLLAHRQCGAIDLEAVVERSVGFTPADLVAVCVRAERAAFEREMSSGQSSQMETADLLAAVAQCRPSLSARHVAAFQDDLSWYATSSASA